MAETQTNSNVLDAIATAAAEALAQTKPTSAPPAGAEHRWFAWFSISPTAGPTIPTRATRGYFVNAPDAAGAFAEFRRRLAAGHPTRQPERQRLGGSEWFGLPTEVGCVSSWGVRVAQCTPNGDEPRKARDGDWFVFRTDTDVLKMPTKRTVGYFTKAAGASAAVATNGEYYKVSAEGAFGIEEFDAYESELIVNAEEFGIQSKYVAIAIPPPQKIAKTKATVSPKSREPEPTCQTAMPNAAPALLAEVTAAVRKAAAEGASAELGRAVALGLEQGTRDYASTFKARFRQSLDE